VNHFGQIRSVFNDFFLPFFYFRHLDLLPSFRIFLSERVFTATAVIHLPLNATSFSWISALLEPNVEDARIMLKQHMFSPRCASVGYDVV
jgi:hypothetical protein